MGCAENRERLRRSPRIQPLPCKPSSTINSFVIFYLTAAERIKSGILDMTPSRVTEFGILYCSTSNGEELFGVGATPSNLQIALDPACLSISSNTALRNASSPYQGWSFLYSPILWNTIEKHSYFGTIPDFPIRKTGLALGFKALSFNNIAQ
jgi:hypothetical protein